MWCTHCQQDVPGVALRENRQRVCCARCGEPVTSPEPSKSPPDAGPSDSYAEVAIPWPRPDDDQELRFLARGRSLVRGILQDGSPAMRTDRRSQTEDHDTQNRQTPPASTDASTVGRSRNGTWLFVVCGGLLFAMGAGGACLSLFVQPWLGVETDLRLAAGLAVGGQTLLLCGLGLQLWGLRRTEQQYGTTLQELEQQVQQLRAGYGETNAADAKSESFAALFAAADSLSVDDNPPATDSNLRRAA